MEGWHTQAIKLNRDGHAWRKIARLLGVPKSTVSDFLRVRMGKEGSKKILCFDIETAPMVVYTWDLWPKFISHDSIIEDWSVLTWSAKWLGQDDMMNASVDPKSPRDDFDVCEQLWQLFDKADIIVGHNGDRFDIKKMNTRFLLHGFPEPLPYRSVDTLKIAKRKFSFSSNRLDYISKATGGEGKVSHEGFPMWVKCLKGDKTALADMQRYNDGDVLELERIYLRLRGWDNLHPNTSLYTDSTQLLCPVCGGGDVEPTGGFSYTQTAKYATYRCKTLSCGKISRARVSEKLGQERKNIIIPTR